VGLDEGLEFGQSARFGEGQQFDCCNWLHKARVTLPKGFQAGVRKGTNRPGNRNLARLPLLQCYPTSRFARVPEQCRGVPAAFDAWGGEKPTSPARPYGFGDEFLRSNDFLGSAPPMMRTPSVFLCMMSRRLSSVFFSSYGEQRRNCFPEGKPIAVRALVPTRYFATNAETRA